ncbi:hypothetical protein KY285_037862 [Solanum tuberosum]|nr:hypothetical protein KY285_037862 [Solanum tuberosum]
MANQTSTKRKLKTEVGSSSKAKNAKTKKKRGRKVAPPIFRPTLPMYLLLDWATLDAYKDNKTGELLGPQHPFEVEFARGIMQQNTAFAEFLSDEIKVPSIPFQSEYLRSRYATLLWKYGTDKPNAGYVSENDDPIRLKVASILLADDELFNVE